VRIVVPFPPGGATDITARVLAEKLQAKWGQPVLVENRPGAGGNLGSELVAKAPPDGHTMVLGVTGSHGINVSLYRKMAYHPLNDFEPVVHATLYPNVIAVHPSVPASGLKELIDRARAAPGQLSYGSDGNGTASHLGMELVKARAKVFIVHLPYRGSAPLLADLIGGQIQIGVTGLPAVLPHARAGRVRMLAVTTPQRAEAAPEVGTVAEQGFPGYVAAPWSGFFVPKGTPAAIVDRLSADLNAAMQFPDARQKMIDAGAPLVGGTPAQFRAFVEAEIRRWAEAVKFSGATVD
jgi:tripartite-type tricarboxylate transporter receptor subunit TctC